MKTALSVLVAAALFASGPALITTTSPNLQLAQTHA
jgi:hypothetical protein